MLLEACAISHPLTSELLTLPLRTRLDFDTGTWLLKLGGPMLLITPQARFAIT